MSLTGVGLRGTGAKPATTGDPALQLRWRSSQIASHDNAPADAVQAEVAFPVTQLGQARVSSSIPRKPRAA
mgnify:CR=1 FL=1